MMLTSNDPFAATSAALRALDQLTGRSGTTTARPLAGMPMDAYRVGDNFVAHFDLPGVDPGSIDLQVEGIGQWTGCVADTGRVEPDTGLAIVRRQWWPHAGLTVAWGIMWR